MSENTRYTPALATAKIKWWTPRGVIYVAVRSTYRYWITGQTIIGPGDNASFLRDATKDYRDGPVEKLSRARWHRVSRRWAIGGVPGLATVPAFFSDTARLFLFCYCLATATAGMTYAINNAGAWMAVRETRRTFIYPAAEVLARVTGTKFSRREAINIIDLPEGFGEFREGEDPKPVRVFVPEIALDPAVKKRIEENVGKRLGVPDAVGKWTESGVPRRFVELSPMRLPKAVTLADLMALLLATDIDHPIVGIQSNGQPAYMDFRNDSPHTLGSAGSGAGKSTLYKFIAMQRMRNGAYAIILDFKKWSHLRWAGHLVEDGRVRIEDEVHKIHNLLCKVLDELLWRKSFDLKDEEKLNALPRLDVYVEEINTLMDLLTQFWTAEVARMKQEARTKLRRIKEQAKASEDPDFFEDQIEEAEEELARAQGLPKLSPALQSLRFGVNLGREFGVHFHFIGQSMSAKAAGGRDTRASFRTRMLARWDAKDWKMLADGIPFVACPSAEVGIWAHVHGSSYEIVRVPFVSNEDAVEFVLMGVRPSGPMFHDDPSPTIEAASRPSIAPAAALSEIVKILPAKADGSRMTLDALRTASKRDGFPGRVAEPEPGKAALYAPEEIVAWFRDRERLPSIGQ